MSNKILVPTPTYTGGSWVVVEELLKVLRKKNKIYCLGFGEFRPIEGVRIFSLPYFRLDTLPNNWGSNIFFNLLFQLPLLLASVILYLVIRPKIVLANGFTAPLAIMPLAKVFGSRTIIYSNTYLHRAAKNPVRTFLIRKLDFFTDAAFVNSEGSLEDISPFINPRKITVVEHWTDFKSYSLVKRRQLRSEMGLDSQFVLSFIGKTSFEKGFDIFLKVVNKLKSDKSVVIQIAGPEGGYSQEIKRLNKEHPQIRDLGFIRDREDLKRILTVSDLVWSFGDETYLAKPAIESLACGTPVIVPDRPAVSEKFENAKIPKTLIPDSVGWIVDADSPQRIAAIIGKAKVEKLTDKMRRNCVLYAKERHSYRNVLKAIKVVERFQRD